MKLPQGVKMVIPNVVTLTGLSLGVVSILLSIHGRYIDAAWFIVLCCLFDKLDGTVARLLDATSDIGLQLDSLSDLVTFGIAPGILVYCHFTYSVFQAETVSPLFVWSLRVSVFALVIASAVRLARFNVTTTKVPEGYFQGLPTTLCGGIIAVLALTLEKYDVSGIALNAFPFYIILLSFLMVSRIPLPKFKRRRNKFVDWFQTINLVIGYVFGILRLFPEYLLFMALFYTVFGFSYSLLHKKSIEARQDEPA